MTNGGLAIVIFLAATLGGSLPGHAQGTDAAQVPPPLFGFGLFLAPMAVKWACAGKAEGDLRAIRDYVRALAPTAGAEDVLAELATMERLLADGEFTVERALGLPPERAARLDPPSRARLCDAASRLGGAEDIISAGDSPSATQFEAWGVFYDAGEKARWKRE